MACCRQALGNALQYTLAHFIECALDRILESETVGRAVAFYHDAFEAQQTGAVVARRIHPAIERREHGHGHDAAKISEPVALEFIGEESAQHLGQAFGGLEGDISHETVAHHHIRSALEDVVAFDVAVKIEAARAQQFSRLLHDFIALDCFLADVEQSDAGAFLVLHGRYQHGTHDGELQQMLGRAVDVGGQVEHIDLAFHGWQYAGDGGTVYPRQSLEHEARNSHQRTGIAGADAGVRFSVLDQIDGDAHGRVLLAAQCRGERLVHAHRLARMMHAQVRARRGVPRTQLGFYRVVQTDQNDIAMRMRLLEVESSGNSNAGPVIAPHAIDGYRGVHLVAAVLKPACGRANGCAARLQCARRAYSPLDLTIFLPR